MATASAAGGGIEVMFLQQIGDDPFTATPERAEQIKEVAGRIADFISKARTSLDIAIYDFRLNDGAAAIITEALRERAANNVAIRIIYDATTEPSGDGMPSVAPGTYRVGHEVAGHGYFCAFLRRHRADPAGHRLSRADAQQISGARRCVRRSRGVSRLGELHERFWGLQENNLFAGALASAGVIFLGELCRIVHHRSRIPNHPTDRDVDAVRVGEVPVMVAFAPGQSPAIVKEIVGAITAARARLLVASVVLSSGPILAALSEARSTGA